MKNERPIANPLLLIIAGWLLPGSGFFMLDKEFRRRGLLMMLVVHLTFFIGVLLHAGVVSPAIVPDSMGTNIVSSLTFLIQTGAGWSAIISWSAYMADWNALAADEAHAMYELGSFYCLVAGALNYFIVCQTLDRNHNKPFEKLVTK